MQIAGYKIETVNFGMFRLDGGSMFGAVPKNLWSKLTPADEENRITLATRSLVLTGNDRKILVDVGNGDKWSDKLKKIYAIKNLPLSELGFEPHEITDVILTHLHFDHAAGISRYNNDGELELTYPKAQIHLQKDNFKNALNPNPREKASYLKEHVEILKSPKLTLIEGDAEIMPGISVSQINGHTRGQQYIEIRDDKVTLLFPSDLCPTSNHLPLPYNMGYDICTETLLKEKEHFLKYALEKDAIVVFEHDPKVTAARITTNERGHYCIKEQVEI